MKHAKVPPSACPSCRKVLDGVTAMDLKSAPQPGNVTVCAYCKAVSRFGPDLKLTQLTTEEYEALPSETRVGLMRAAAIVSRVQVMGQSLNHPGAGRV